MSHAEVRERLELAAAEPGAFERLMAGDTSDAAMVAGHLAGCEPCREEFARLRRTSFLLRNTISTLPSPELKDRTLAYVAALGRDRSGVTVDTAPAGLAPAGALHALPASDPSSLDPPRASGRTRIGGGSRGALPWLAVAAAVLIAVGATALSVSSSRDAQLRAATADVADLSRVAATTVAIETRPDAKSVALNGTDGEAARGSLLFSPSTRQLVVVATDLAEPPAGKEYRCWLELGGARQRVGRMFFAGDVAYWAGPVETLQQAVPGTRFGVTLVDAGSSSLAGDPTLAGQL